MFKSWCAAQKFNNATNLSHVLMDGGVLSVPFDKLNTFYERYIEAVKGGERLYVVEQKSEKYNFFVDIDYKDKEALDLDEIKDVCKVICDKVKRHGGKECLISVSPPKKCGGDLIKTGVHLNWPEFVVDQSSAVALREHILVALSKAKGRGTDWNDIIDVAVYGNVSRKTKGSGFRMPWSYKKAKHAVCDGQGCSECEKGKVDQLAYLPVFMYHNGPLSTILKIGQDPTLEILKMAAVRTDAPQITHVEPPSTTVKEGTFTVAQTKDEVHDDTLKGKIEDFIRTHIEGQKHAYIPKIFKKKDTYLVSTTSKYCENLKREHGSNHVWFIISGQTILQKCFCLCETLRGRRDGFCKDFCGRKHQLTPSIVEGLYPKKEDIKKCPQIKKRVEKPQVKCGDVKTPLEVFIRKNMRGPEDLQVLTINKDKTQIVALTNSAYCETIKGMHEDVVMSYLIKGKEIKQKCPKCKKNTSRTHCLTPDIIKILKQ
tara:strand:+ start:1659 stop:3113 length:1455 start_codon:yes stop_codon:yes gene_type:complete